MMNLYTKQNDNPGQTPAAAPAPKPAKPSFEKYVDPTGELSSQDLRYGMWYVQHRVVIYRCVVLGLVAIGAVLWAFSLWQWGSYLIFGVSNDILLERQTSQSINYRPAEQHFSAAPLQVLSTNLFPGGVDKYDTVSEVANPNDRFLARGTYYYIIDGEKTKPKPFFILPGSSMLLAELGIKNSGGPGSADLVIETMDWKRVSSHQIKDTKAWQEERLNFALNDFDFTSLAGARGAQANVITFSLVNQSPYAYSAPYFYVGLFNQDVLVGVMPLAVDSFASLETKKIDLRNFVNTLTASSAKLFPLINVYDPTVYLPPAK
ncbi:MAG: hypothetical protein HY983_03105 [Candidatus Magasanikbacteria bacterium]|nr:hypothetical protein [Candidatus Magasanikbacteria bacterium]